MNLPLLTITALAGELRNSLVGSVIVGVEPLPWTGLCLQATRASKAYSLCLATHPSFFCPFLCTAPHVAGQKTTFARNLLRLLEGHTITAIEQWQHDRILRVEFRKVEEIHGVRKRVLILELVPRRQNLIVMDLDSGMILEVFRRVTGEMSRFRHILPGHPYQSPPRLEGVHPQTSSPQEFLKSALLYPQELTAEALARCLPWASDFLLKELFSRLSLDMKVTVSELTKTQLLNLWKIITTWAEELENGPLQPTLISGQKDRRRALLPYDPKSVPRGRKRLFTTLSQALENLFQDFAEQWAGEVDRRAMVAVISRALRRSRRTLKRLEANHSDSQRAEEFRKLGEVIVANMGRLKKGMSQAQLPDPYSTKGEVILVPLNPRLSPADNAKQYFKRFRKAKAGLPKIERRLREVRFVLKKLEDLRRALGAAPEAESLERIKAQLSQMGIQTLPGDFRGAPRAQRPRRPPLAFTLRDGWTIWVGRNNRENELLTHRMAGSRDLWFHAQGVAGSHVILRREGRKGEPSKKVLEAAAAVAAYFSRARHSKTVPVIYTEKRYVRKPKGAKPGVVAVERERTLFVVPKLIQRNDQK